MYWVVFPKPFFDHFPLRCQDDSNPFHCARTLVVFSHDIRGFVEDLDQTVRLVPPEVVSREGCMVFLHLLLE